MAPLAFIARRHLKSRHTFGFISLISYLAILGLGIGIAVLILTLGILSGFEEEVQRKIISFDGHIRLRGFMGNPVPENNPVLDSIMVGIPEIVARAPYIHHAAMIRSGTETESVFIEGISAEGAAQVFGTPETLIRGSFDFTPDDAHFKGVVLGSALAEKLDISIGSRIVLLDLESIGSFGKPPRIKQFHVAGIYETGLKEYDESVVYIDLKTAQHLFAYSDLITGEILRVKDTELSHKVAEILEEKAGYPYSIITWRERHFNLFAWLSVQKYPITFIFALIALVAIVNITSSLTMIVMEKTRDVGILRAIGFTQKQIHQIFMLEGGIIGIMGVFFGATLALFLGYLQLKYGLLRIPEDVYFMKELPILLKPLQIVSVAAVGLLLSLVASLYPAWKGSGFVPAEAIRYE